MFHWICPECGREIAPAVKECPVCDPVSSSGLDVVSLSTSLRSPADLSVSSLSSPSAAAVLPAPVALALVQPEVVHAQAVAIQDAPEPEPASEPLIDLRAHAPLEPLQIPLFRTQIAKPRPPMEHNASPEPESFADRLAALAEQLKAGPIANPKPGIASLEIIDLVPSTSTEAASPEHSIEPEAHSIGLLPAPPIVALLGEPAPPRVADQLSLPSSLDPRPAQPPQWASAGLEVPHPAASAAVVFQSAPSRSYEPGLADLKDLTAHTDRAFRAKPPADGPIANDVIHRITLPGPKLPRELTSLQAAGLVPAASERAQKLAQRSKGIPGWIMTGLVTVTMLVVGTRLVFYAVPGLSASPTPSTSTPAPQAAPVVEEEAHPISTYVEVTGLRFLNEPTPQVKYLVVNHSKGSLSGITIYVTLRKNHAKLGQPPVSQFSFRAPKLAPFEAKELSSPFELAKGTAAPDWQDLRADVEISQ